MSHCTPLRVIGTWRPALTCYQSKRAFVLAALVVCISPFLYIHMLQCITKLWLHVLGIGSHLTCCNSWARGIPPR